MKLRHHSDTNTITPKHHPSSDIKIIIPKHYHLSDINTSISKHYHILNLKNPLSQNITIPQTQIPLSQNITIFRIQKIPIYPKQLPSLEINITSCIPLTETPMSQRTTTPQLHRYNYVYHKTVSCTLLMSHRPEVKTS